MIYQQSVLYDAIRGPVVIFPRDNFIFCNRNHGYSVGAKCAEKIFIKRWFYW
jgi:hypothetical protein